MSARVCGTAKINTRTAELFEKASPELKALVRAILHDEREVMLMKRRSDIHQRIYEHVKRVIK